MPTLVQVRRDGIPMHRHPTRQNPEGRWHGPWERHPQDIYAHMRELAGYPESWMNDAAAELYHRALRGEQLIDWSAARRGARTSVGQPPIEVSGWSLFPRRYGVEIECIGNRTEIINGLRARDLAAHSEGYGHNVTSDWKLTSDGSLHYSGHRAGFQTMEIVSPILTRDTGLTQLAGVCEVLRNTGTIVNRSCGLHVHHDMTNILTVTLAATLARNYMNAQKAIDKLVADSRRSSTFNTYCRPYDNYEVEQLARGTSIRDISNLLTRYKTLNIGPAYARHHTIEFRQHQGTIEFEKIAAWIQMGQFFIEASIKGTVISQTNNIGEFLDAIEMPQATKEFFFRRSLELVGRSD